MTAFATGPVTVAEIPADSDIARVYPAANLADAFSIDLPDGTTASPEVLARFIFSQQATWVAALMKLRDALVAGFGLKTSTQLKNTVEAGGPKRVGFFRIYSANEREIVLGEDDSHLDFRVSVWRSADAGPDAARRLVLSTVVNCHNRLGRLYIFFIAPFHRLVVRSSLRRAAAKGWPRASEG